MQDEITVSPLVDILTKQLREQVAMNGNEYVYLKGLLPVSQNDVDIALLEQTKVLEVTQALAITAEASKIIEKKYDALKQRKVSSIAISLLDKKLDNPLATDEEVLLQSCRDINTWISSIRTIENEAIANKIALDKIDWEAV